MKCVFLAYIGNPQSMILLAKLLIIFWEVFMSLLMNLISKTKYKANYTYTIWSIIPCIMAQF